MTETPKKVCSKQLNVKKTPSVCKVNASWATHIDHRFKYRFLTKKKNRPSASNYFSTKK